ncbi:MAG: tetratricopeptide repeat protein [Proteobacteria bacterium]|nr:tetratricopeptide repeat protein [Pseudomonadota bacterium]
MGGRSQKTLLITGLFVLALTTGCGGAQKGQDSAEADQNAEAQVQSEADYFMEQAGFALSEEDNQGAYEYYLEAARVYDESGQVSVERAEAHFLAASLAYQIGEKLQAIEEYDASVAIYLRFTGNSKIKAAVALNNMGTIYKEMEKYGQAQNCWEKALNIYQKAPPELQSKRNIAKIKQNLSDLAEGF